MSLVTPEKIQPFSEDFSRLINDIVGTLNRYEELINEMWKVRMNPAFPGDAGGGSGELCFFQIDKRLDCTGGPEGGNRDAELCMGTIYMLDTGPVDDGDQPSAGTVIFHAYGWHIGGSVNWPVQHPQIEGMSMAWECEQVGSVFMAKKVGPKTCIFANAFPRIGASCPEEDG
tara:strand:- start:2264 stop:2779 length:516 start_codon:yes stop_codon:yes gene_type:complete